MDSSIKDSFYEEMIPFKVKFNKQKILFKSDFLSYLPLAEKFSTGDNCRITNSSFWWIWVSEQECKYKVEQITIPF